MACCAATRPHDDVFLLALNGYGNSLLASGRAEDAVTVLHEAVEMARATPEPTPVRELDVLMVQTNLARALAGAGLPDRAAAQQDEAVEYCQRFAANDPKGFGRYLPGLMQQAAQYRATATN